MKSLLPSILLLLSAAAMAQNRVGFTTGWNTSYASRINAFTFEADLLLHVDDRDYRDWAIDPADPTGNTYLVDGMHFWLQDENHVTLESFRIVAYNEDRVVPDQPDPNGAWFRSGVINLPPAPYAPPWYTPPFPNNVPIAWAVNLTFPPGAVRPTSKGDKWFGVNLGVPATVVWPVDGLSVHTATDFNSVNTNIDKPGPRAASINQGQLSCYIPTANGLPVGAPVYPSPAPNNREQIFVELLVGIAGGVCVTQTNQTLYPASNPGASYSTPLGGTTNFLSGLHPDLTNYNRMTPPRADDLGFLVRDGSLPPRSLVFLVLAFGPSPIGSLPLQTLIPNATGNVCINFVEGSTLLSLTDGTGVAQFDLQLNSGQRALLAGMSPSDFWYQALVLTQTAAAHATGCGIQHL